MFKAFLSYFDEETETIYTGDLHADFISQLGGKSFGNGLFCSFSCENIVAWTKVVEEAYPDFKNMFRLFGFDWLGRCFGIDLRDETQGKILMFEIGTGGRSSDSLYFGRFFKQGNSTKNGCMSGTKFLYRMAGIFQRDDGIWVLRRV